MTIVLPKAHRATDYVLEPVRNSRAQRAGTGGSLSPISRPGDHWSVEVNPVVLSTACGRRLLADIVRGVGERLRVPIPQRGLDIGAPGTPRVKGAGQSGASLLLDGVTPYYAFRKGQFITVKTPEGPTAHLISADAVADAAGEVTITFWPIMWLEPADNGLVEVLEPYIEGLIVDEGGQASGVFPAVMTDAFTVAEG